MDSCCFRDQRSTRSTWNSTIRVVHLNGLIEDYESPITVHQVIAIYPKHFIITPIQLVQIGLVPIKTDTVLEPGRVYFILPCSFIRLNESTRDLIPLTKKLTNIAKTRQTKPKLAPSANQHLKETLKTPLLKTNLAKGAGLPAPAPAPLAIPQIKRSNQKSLKKNLSNIGKPPRVKDKATPESTDAQDKETSAILDDGSNRDTNVTKRKTKGFSWKPLLATIRERSFNRRESDLND